MKLFHKVFSFISYLLRSFHLHGIHSPFVFNLQHDVIRSNERYYAFDEIESIRAKLLLTTKEIEVVDFGAGSTYTKSNTRTIQSIAKQASKKPKHAQLLFRIAYHFQPKTILELGTSLGLTTAYLGKACPNAKIITLEGSDSIAKVARVNHNKLNIHNIKLLVGEFSQHLDSAIEDLQTIDFAYVDGNHKKEPTLAYFEKLLLHKNENSIFVFDDIYWSKEMTAAWNEIKKHKAVRQTVDLYEFGLVFFKNDQEREHFTVYH